MYKCFFNIYYKLYILIFCLRIIMDEEVPQKTTFSTSDLKLYVYGSR